MALGEVRQRIHGHPVHDHAERELVADCPGRKPPFWAVKKCPALPYKGDIQNDLLRGTLRVLNRPGRARTVLQPRDLGAHRQQVRLDGRLPLDWRLHV